MLLWMQYRRWLRALVKRRGDVVVVEVRVDIAKMEYTLDSSLITSIDTKEIHLSFGYCLLLQSAHSIVEKMIKDGFLLFVMGVVF